MALLQADGQYNLERGLTNGGASHLYRAGPYDHLGANTVPSTDTYQGGRVCGTYNFLSNISAPAPVMYVDYSYYNRVLYVDKYYLGPFPAGTCDAPYKRVTDAYNAAFDGDTIVIRAADNAEAPLSMNKRLYFDTRRGTAGVH